MTDETISVLAELKAIRTKLESCEDGIQLLVKHFGIKPEEENHPAASPLAAMKAITAGINGE